ncbi:MAG: hypothetical protein DMF61_02995 [Blastocatellia bacterium AA13]|nr:MAG: hypothetical protein DMF61_02995 [Blastocatellia bacterium AA13]
MCGRFVRKKSSRQIAEQFHAQVLQELPPSYNIAPTDEVSAIIADPEQGRSLVSMRWGLVPKQAADIRVGARLINARSETLERTAAFRNPFKYRRCLIVASGFYEWEKIGKEKIPMLLRLRSDETFAFAGLYDVWTPPSGAPVTTCTIITTEPNEAAKPIHDRMPVILARGAEDLWLSPEFNPEVLNSLLRPYPSQEMEAFEVSRLVNSVKNDSPECIEPVAWSERLF